MWHLLVTLMASGVYEKYHTCVTNSGDITQSVSILIDVNEVVVSISMAMQLAVAPFRKLLVISRSSIEEVVKLKRDTRSLLVSMRYAFSIFVSLLPTQW